MSELPDRKRLRLDQIVIVIALLGFVAITSVGVASHEMWRDEHHAWLIARDAAGPVDLLRNLEWDMNPPVWHYVLWVVTRVTHDPHAMQAVNLLFATVAAWLILRFAPFALHVRVLVIFGYFFAYEYAAISRVYALGAMLIFSICALWPRRDSHPVAVGVLLVLLANTPALYGAVSAGFFVLLYLIEIRTRQESRKSALVGFAIGTFGILLALVQVIPQPDNPFAYGKMTAAFEPDRIALLAKFVVSVLIPIPDPGVYEYWNSNVIAGRSVSLDIGLALVCLAVPVFLLRKYRDALIAWGAVTLAVLFAGYQGLFVGVRHGSFIYVMLIAGLWVGFVEKPEVVRGRAEKGILAVFLALGVAGAGVALTREVQTRFTAVDATARFLHENGFDRMPIAGANDFVVASLSSLLDLDRIYYPQKGSWGTFVQWSPDRRLNTTLGELGRDVAQKVSESGAPMVVVLSQAPTRKGPQGEELVRAARLSDEVRIRFIAAFTESVVPDEKLWVYIAEPSARHAAP